MKVSRIAIAAVAAVIGAAALASTALTASPVVTTAPVVAFQAAGDVGGGGLPAGTSYPPSSRGEADLRRTSDTLHVNIRTSGLPAGAYTVWWVIFDSPDGCSEACGEDDLFNEAADVSVFLASGKVVGAGGNATFVARYRVGDDPGDPGTQLVLGDADIDPSRAEVHNVIKYHGPASADPAVRKAQLSTLQGGCDQGANAVDLGEPFGVQCFDPQAVVHPRP